jgi:hypothetical protein
MDIVLSLKAIYQRRKIIVGHISHRERTCNRSGMQHLVQTVNLSVILPKRGANYKGTIQK